MRILLSALVGLRPRTGVGTYAVELARAWPADAGAELLVATPEPDEFRSRLAGAPVEVLPLPVRPGGGLGHALALQGRIPGLARRVSADLVLCPNFLAPLRRGPFTTAVVVQDLAFVHHGSTIPLGRRMYYGALARRSIRHASVVLATTRTIADELAGFEPSVASRTRIAPLGVSPAHLATDPELTDRPGGALLSVGTLEPRKNLGRVLTAHGRLCRRFSDFPSLRLVGAAGWGKRQVLDALAGHPAPWKVARLGYLSDQDLATEYRRSRGLVFCSLYEGFGLPVVEAMAHGCPVLCSRGTALAEVAGGAALLVDPKNLGEMEQGMLRLATDAPARARLRVAGRRRAEEFTWERCARRTLDALTEPAAAAAARGV